MATSPPSIFISSAHPRLLRWPSLYSPRLRNSRDLWLLLPPSYQQQPRRHYPVVYLHDGQNLFLRDTSFAGHWRAIQTMDRLAEEGIEALLVGITNTGRRRLYEYTPPVASRWQGGADQYLEFVASTVKPLVDATFRTHRDPDSTSIVGSSLGGLVSLWAFLDRPDVFGHAGVMSPSVAVGGRGLFRYLDHAELPPGRLYLDVGTREIRGRRRGVKNPSRYFGQQVTRLRDGLLEKGMKKDRDLVFVRETGGIHHESAWGRRLPGALRFLLAGQPPA